MNAVLKMTKRLITMSNEHLVNEFEEAILAKLNSDDEIAIQKYDEARNALFDAVNAPNPALAVIEYTLDTNNHDHESGVQLDFLGYWSLGEFDTLRRNWENIPDEVFIGADSQFKPTVKSECIHFVLDARTMKPVKLSELEEYSFCNEDEDLYLMMVMIMDVTRMFTGAGVE